MWLNNFSTAPEELALAEKATIYHIDIGYRYV